MSELHPGVHYRQQHLDDETFTNSSDLRKHLQSGDHSVAYHALQGLGLDQLHAKHAEAHPQQTVAQAYEHLQAAWNLLASATQLEAQARRNRELAAVRAREAEAILEASGVPVPEFDSERKVVSS